MARRLWEMCFIDMAIVVLKSLHSNNSFLFSIIRSIFCNSFNSDAIVIVTSYNYRDDRNRLKHLSFTYYQFEPVFSVTLKTFRQGALWAVKIGTMGIIHQPVLVSGVMKDKFIINPYHHKYFFLLLNFSKKLLF